MQAPDPIEVVLARLMPPGLSQQGQVEIEAMIGELAGPENSRGPSWFIRCAIGGGIAAAIGALIAVFPTEPAARPSAVAEADPGYSLVSGSDRIESMTDEGWQEDADGLAMHTLRLKAIEENQVRDEGSGMVVLISEPREEVLSIPVSAF